MHIRDTSPMGIHLCVFGASQNNGHFVYILSYSFKSNTTGNVCTANVYVFSSNNRTRSDYARLAVVIVRLISFSFFCKKIIFGSMSIANTFFHFKNIKCMKGFGSKCRFQWICSFLNFSSQMRQKSAFVCKRNWNEHFCCCGFAGFGIRKKYSPIYRSMPAIFIVI